MRLLLTTLFALTLASSAAAAPLPPAARAEVDALLASLQTSGCQFNRNGAWYTAAEAQAHLLRKLDYLQNKDQVHSTEQFIDLAASKSSVSGKPYWVKCGSAAQEESHAWLGKRLQAIRSPGRTPASGSK